MMIKSGAGTKKTWLGSFEHAEDAARAYDKVVVVVSREDDETWLRGRTNAPLSSLDTHTYLRPTVHHVYLDTQPPTNRSVHGEAALRLGNDSRLGLGWYYQYGDF